MAARKKHLKIGLIGTGYMGKEHLKGIRDIVKRKLLPVSLEAVANMNHERGEAVAKEYGCRYYDSGDALIADPTIDVVVIATPTHEHLRLATLAAKAGKAIFLEKPLGRNLAEARKVADVLKKTGALHQIGLVLRFSPTYNVLKAMLADKQNGAFVFCRFRDDQFFPIKNVYDSDWRGRPEFSGGGTLIEHSIHDVDVIQWFFGEAKLEDAMLLPSHRKGIEKLAALNLKFESETGKGGRAQLSSIWHHNLTRENERHIEIFFEHRYFHTLGGFTSPIEVQGPKGKPTVIGKEEIEKQYRKMIRWTDSKNADFPSTLGHEMFVFLKRVLKGESGAVTVEAGVAAHRLIEQAYRTGKMESGS